MLRRLLLAGLLAMPLPAMAEAAARAITITGPFVRATPPRAPVAGAYLLIANAGPQDDILLGAVTEAGRPVEIHDMSIQDGAMMMRPLPEGLAIPAGSHVLLAPGGAHLMVTGLTDSLPMGAVLRLTLRFARAGEIAVDFDVLAPGARSHPDWPASGG